MMEQEELADPVGAFPPFGSAIFILSFDKMLSSARFRGALQTELCGVNNQVTRPDRGTNSQARLIVHFYYAQGAFIRVHNLLVALD
jgi:hypothetical protein